MDRLIKFSYVIFIGILLCSCEKNIEKKYYSNGQIQYEVPLKNNLREGEMISYFEDGKVSLKAKFINGKLNGKTAGYDSLGNIISVIEYKDDVKHGLAEMYYPNGNIKSRAEHVNGELIGPLLEYFDNGNVSKKYFFDKNSEIIYFKSFSKQGVLYESLLPISTELNGSSNNLRISLEYTEFDSAGMLILIGNLDANNRLIDTLEVFKVRDLDFDYKINPDQKVITGMVYELKLPEVKLGGNYFFKYSNE